MFDPFILDREDPIYKAVMQRQMPIVEGDDGPIDETWFTGVRSTQIIYLHNPVTSYQAAAFSPATSQVVSCSKSATVELSCRRPPQWVVHYPHPTT